ncbi:condensation domain-containing protein, partial [Lysinibacillus xylanilyticus]|uniref:condensation domain-containing protein n=1 Tax=Lysinibacillus xylanilyticus TaxID=582475 RepID=UPI003816FBC6
MEKLDRKNIENIMSLTSLQQIMLFNYIKDEESEECHEQLSLTISGDIKVDIFQKSWDFVVENNEMMRTVFRWKGIDKPVQIVKKSHGVTIQYFDFTDELEKGKMVEEVKLKDFSTRIDISKETLRVYLCKLENYKYEMIITNHHILYDGWSNGLILKELFEAYTCFYHGDRPKALTKTKFGEFVNYTLNLNGNDQKEYWNNYFNESDNARCCFEGKTKGEYKEIIYKLDNENSHKIEEFAKRNRISLAALLYSAWGVLMQKFSNSHEVIFGTTVSGRTDKIRDIDNMVGLFINIIPMTLKSEDKILLMDLVRNVDEVLSRRKDFENTPLIDIKENCGLKTNEDLFNSVVTIENYPLNISKNNILSIEKFSMIERNNYNISLQILTFDGIEFKFDFNSLVVEEAIVDKFTKYLENIMICLIDNKDIRVSEIGLLSEEEKSQILYEFNNTKADYPNDKTIQKLFEEQVEKTPDRIAVVFEEKKLTYRELNEKANRLAWTLREKGAKPETIVAIMVERSVEMIVGVLAIIKSGAAYMPIDPNLPQDRVSYILQKSDANILVTESEFINNVDSNYEVIDINEDIVYS